MSEPAMERWQPRVFTAESLMSADERMAAERQRGYTDGLGKGEAEAERRLQEKLSQFDAILGSLEQPLQDMNKDVSEHLLSLVIATTRAILKRELVTDDSVIRDSLDEALSALSGASGDIEVSLHPDDEALVSGLLKDQRDKVTIVANPDIFRGGCLVKRNDSLVDATIEEKCKAVLEQLANEAPRAVGSTENDILDADRIQAIADRFQSGNPE